MQGGPQTSPGGGFITLEQLKAAIGKQGPLRVAPPVCAGDIRRFAIAAYWPQRPPRLFWDDEYAQQTRWRGIIAPEEFNPFAWPVEGPGRLPASPPKLADVRSYNGGNEAEYHAPIRPGDVISGTDQFLAVDERPGRSGRLIFITKETRWSNQHSELVKVLRCNWIQVLPQSE